MLDLYFTFRFWKKALICRVDLCCSGSGGLGGLGHSQLNVKRQKATGVAIKRSALLKIGCVLSREALKYSSLSISVVSATQTHRTVAAYYRN